MAQMLELPRIVCHDCPAVVEVLHFDKHSGDLAESYIAGLRCHGETFLVRIRTEQMKRFEADPQSLVLQDLLRRKIDVAGMWEAINEREESIAGQLQLARFYHEALIATGAKPPDAPERRAKYIEMAEWFMNYAEIYK